MKESKIKYDYLANHGRQCIAEIADPKYNEWKNSSPETTLLQRRQETADSCNTDKFPITFVALDGNEMAGFVTAIRCGEKFEYRNSVWLVALYIKTEYRGKGIATGLLSFAENQLKALDVAVIRIWTEKEELNDYYAKRGWRFGKQVPYKEDSASLFYKRLLPKRNSKEYGYG